MTDTLVQVKLLFNLYDVDQDGFITPLDMKQTLYTVLTGGFDWAREHNSKIEAETAAFDANRVALEDFILYLRVCAVVAVKCSAVVRTGGTRGLYGRMG